MLTRFHKILIGVLAAQIVLTVIVLMAGDATAPTRERVLLQDFDASKVTRVQVFGGAAPADGKPADGKPAVDLVKRGDKWALASAYDHPVEATKITEALAPIGKMSAGDPIASQSGRHKQLRVGDGEFERKLVITRDGKDLTLYIGSAAGLRRTAVRFGGSDDVYAVGGVSAFAFGTEPRGWVAASYLAIPREDIAKLTLETGGKLVDIERVMPPAPPAAGSGSAGSAGSAAPAPVPPPVPPAPAAGSAPAPAGEPTWKVAIAGAPVALAAGESLDTAAIDTALGSAGTIDLAAPGDPKRDASRPTATLTIARKPPAAGGAAPPPVVLDVIADGERYWVHQRGQPTAALVDKARLADLLALDRDKLVKKPAPPAPPPGAGSGSAAPALPDIPGMPGMPGAPPGPRPGGG